MRMLQAMEKCEIGGHVSRKAYPNIRHLKSDDGKFYSAIFVSSIDFIANDWEPHDPEAVKPIPALEPARFSGFFGE